MDNIVALRIDGGNQPNYSIVYDNNDVVIKQQFDSNTMYPFYDRGDIRPELGKASDVTIKAVSGSGYHKSVLFSDGTVFSAGEPRRNGQGNTDGKLHEVIFPDKVIEVYGWNQVSLYLLENGEVWGHGYNWSRLFEDNTNEWTMSPIQIVALPEGKVWSVVKGNYNTGFAVTDDNKFYVWGSNRVGLLGDPNLELSREVTLLTPGSANLVDWNW